MIMFTKQDIHWYNDSFEEALRLMAVYRGKNILYFLNLICEACGSDLEKSYYMGIMHYVQYPGRAKLMCASKRKNETV
jgi:hypothetical protein